MRLPFPHRISLRVLLFFLSSLVVGQLIEGTDPVFAILMFIAQLSAIMAFNYLGGMTHMAGAFCMFAIVPIVSVPEAAHLLLGQPGDFNLMHPVETAGVCATFFMCVMVAARAVSLIRHPIALLERVRFTLVELRIVSILACIIAIFVQVKILTLDGPLEDGSLLAALNHFCPFLIAISVMMATYVRIKTTAGRSVINGFVIFLLILAVLPGLLNASKEGMLTPLLCWLMVVASSRHRFSLQGLASLATVLLVAWTYVYPFSQNARFPIRAANTVSEKASLVVDYFRNPSQYPDTTSSTGTSTEFGTSTSKVGIVARYSTLPSIDMLIDADHKLGYTGIERYLPTLVSIVPHVIWPNRPTPISSNELGHKAGFDMQANDTTTGIAIGTPAYFFDLGGWLTMIVYTLICFTGFFFVAVRLVNRADSGIWGLIPIGTEALTAGATGPDGMFTLSVTFLGTFIFTLAALKFVGWFVAALVSRSNRPDHAY